MKAICKPLVLAAALCAAGLAAAPARAARVVIGVGVGVPLYGPGYWGPGYGPYYNSYYGAPYGYYGPRRVIVEQPVEVVQPQAPASPDPIFYPKNGQPVAQVEADRQQCNRWAASQPNALADAGTFQRATYACMEGRGYSVR